MSVTNLIDALESAAASVDAEAAGMLPAIAK